MMKISEIINAIREAVEPLKEKANPMKRIGLSWVDGKPVCQLNGHGASDLTRKLDSLQVKGDCIRTITHDFDKIKDVNLLRKLCGTAFANADNELIDRKRRRWYKKIIMNCQLATLTTHGWIDKNFTRFDKVGSSASQTRCAQSTWLRDDIKEAITDWWTMGLPIDKYLPAEKFYTYLMMCDSTTLPYKVINADIIDLINVDFDKIAVFKEIEIENMAKVRHVTSNMVTEKTDVDVEKWADGLIIHIIHTLRFTPEQSARLAAAIADGRLHPESLRLPFVKGMEVFVLDVALEAWCKAKKLNPIRKDRWGNEVNILDCDMIMFESAFKASKAECITSWQMYADKLKEYGHELSVCKVPHFRKADLPYQQMQALMLEQKDAIKVINYHRDIFETAATVRGAISSLSKYERAVAELYPQFLGDIHFQQQIQDVHTRNYAHCANGRILNVGYYIFLAPDIAAVIEALLTGNKRPEGLLNNHEVHIDLCNPRNGKRVFEYSEEKKPFMVGYSRNPAPGMNIMQALNVDVPAEFAGLYMPQVAYVSTHSLTMPVLQADFDGDTILVWDATHGIGKTISESAKAAQKKFDYRCVTFDSNKSAKKASDNYLKDAIMNSKRAEIGLFAIAIAKIVAQYGFGDPRLPILEAWMTLCVDSAKNGGEIPPEIREIVESVKYDKTPNYIGYGKMPAREVGRTHLNEDKFGFYGDSAVDACSNMILKTISPDYDFEHLKVRKFDDSASSTADWRVLCSVDGIAAGKLTGLYTKADGKNVNCTATIDFCNSLFGKLVYEYRNEVSAVSSVEARALVDKTNKDRIKAEVIRFGAARGCNAAVTLNTLVMMIYRREPNETVRKELLRALWLCFGEELAVNAVKNHSINLIPALGITKDMQDVLNKDVIEEIEDLADYYTLDNVDESGENLCFADEDAFDYCEEVCDFEL